MKALREIIRRQRSDLLRLPNVVGVGIGKKRTRGVETDEPAVAVFVEKKLPPDLLPRAARVPKTVEKARTDVVETGRFRLLNTYAGRYRPAQPGVSIGHYRITAGTFGAVVYDRRTGEPLILSNNHILANRSNGADGRARQGDPVLQPGPYDGGEPQRDTIATLLRFVPLHYEVAPATCPVAAGLESYLNALLKVYRPQYSLRLYRRSEAINRVDCAVAKPLDRTLISKEVIGIGPVKGITEAEPGLKVQKCGRTTGLTTGTVEYTDVTSTVDIAENQQALFEDQVMTTSISKGGDSGSLVLDEAARAAGLLFAGSESFTLCNRIQNVLDALNVRF
ncbi:MAG: hypothetical protein AB1330_08510 [Bacillota bacterium]